MNPAPWPDQGLPPQYPPSPPAAAPAHSRRGWLALVLVAVLAAGGFVAYEFLTGSSHDYPGHWDARVLPLVRFVEKDRGLTFEHPIKIEFLTPAEFRARVTRPATGISKAEQVQSADSVSQLRAVGLISGPLDLAKAVRDLRGGSVVGEYSFATKSIAVRGQTLSLSGKVTLVHELTHGLQDQHFAVGDYARRMRSDSEAEDAFRAVTEGDAVRVENDYIRSLPTAERRLAQSQRSADSANADKAIKSVPQILTVIEAQPYVLGRDLLDYQIAANGRSSVDKLFEKWPTSVMQIMQPWRYAAGDDGEHVSRPVLRSGERRFGYGTFGEADWYYMLAQQLGPARAIAVSAGWEGDSYISFHSGTRACFRANYRADTAAHVHAMDAALHSWIKRMPGHHASESLRSGTISFQTCDPGARAGRPLKSRSGAALRFAGGRIEIATALLHSGLPERAAGCAADRIVARLSQHELEATKLTEHALGVVHSSVAACS